MRISKRIVAENEAQMRVETRMSRNAWGGWRVASAQGMLRCRHPWCCRQGGGKRETSVFTVHYGLASRPNGHSLSSRFAAPSRHVNKILSLCRDISRKRVPFRLLYTTILELVTWSNRSDSYDEDNYDEETSRVFVSKITLTILFIELELKDC